MKMPPAQFLALFEGLDRRLVRPRTRAAAGACGMIASEWLSSVLSVAGPRSLCLIAVMTDTALAEANVRLKARLAESEAALADAVEAQRRLECIVSELRREKFGPRSEKLDPEQFNLPLEDVELAQGVLEAAQEKARRALKGQGPANGTPNRNRGHLPKHLPSHRAYHRA